MILLMCYQICVAGLVALPDDDLAPRLDGDPWTIAGDPDLGPHTDPKQQPVDFGLWQAADGTWQLWSCIRGTKCGGKTRLFHRWEGRTLTAPDWEPQGIAMEADPALGETPGGLQAPYVVQVDGQYRMFYGDWERIRCATSRDGKTFTRAEGAFAEAPGANTRDPMLFNVDGTWHCLSTAHPGNQGAVYSRISRDLRTWTDPKIIAKGGAAGSGPYSAECPFVVRRKGAYYLFRTQRYGKNAQTTVYRSRDPRDFGVDDDRCRVGTLEVAAPEIVQHDGQDYIAYLLPSLKGIQIQKLAWEPRR
ncbi:MAG: family 43 glycosylhydrolase [Planctomycetaceae bacterium]|nr:family 43 glycosylhydrolase [Planctomycetaceae bacterium]